MQVLVYVDGNEEHTMQVNAHYEEEKTTYSGLRVATNSRRHVLTPDAKEGWLFEQTVEGYWYGFRIGV